MKTLKTVVVWEDIHIEDYAMRRHCVKTMEREDCVVSLFPFLLCWVVGTTVLLSGVPVNKDRVTEVMLNQILCLRVKTMVVCEVIHNEDYDSRRHSREDYGVRRHSCFVVFFLLCWVIGTTVLLSGVQVNKVRVTEVMLNQILCLRAKTMWANLLQRRMSQLYL